MQPRPGFQTSEFWLGLAASILTALYASGVFTTTTSLAIAGIAATILGALGYTVSRTIVKKAATAASAANDNAPVPPVAAVDVKVAA
jgi:hypothetical protein